MTTLLNRVTGTSPQVVHCNGPRANRVIFEAVAEELVTRRMFGGHVNSNLTVIFCDDRGEEIRSPLWGSLVRAGQSYLRIADRRPGPWKNVFKLEMLAAGLAAVKTDFVMGLDAFDVLAINPMGAWDKFVADRSRIGCNYRMLIGAEKSFFPIGGHPYKRALPPFKEFQEALAPNTAYRYLNSGCWIGEHGFVTEFFDRCLELAKGEYQAFEDDQAIFHVAFAEMWPRVVLDYSCTIFQNLCLVPDSEMAFVEGEKHAERRDCRSAAPPAQ